MSAQARVVGKNPDGSARRYGFTAQDRRVHFLAATGTKAYCGRTCTGAVKPNLHAAQMLELNQDPSRPQWQLCSECIRAAAPQPDPKIWGPKRR